MVRGTFVHARNSHLFLILLRKCQLFLRSSIFHDSQLQNDQYASKHWRYVEGILKVTEVRNLKIRMLRSVEIHFYMYKLWSLEFYNDIFLLKVLSTFEIAQFLWKIYFRDIFYGKHPIYIVRIVKLNWKNYFSSLGESIALNLAWLNN